MHIVLAHNEYGKTSGEEQSIRDLAILLEGHGHKVSWFLRSSAEIQRPSDKVRAFFSGINSFKSEREMTALLSAEAPDLVEVQNLYPFLSPSILAACRKKNIPVVMLCPNYRIFCPSGLHLSHGEICDRCLGGKEYWCVLRNCERDLFKSAAYALRTATARISGRIVANVNVFIVLSQFQKQRFIDSGIDPSRIEILPNIATPVERSPSGMAPTFVTFVGRASPEKGIEDFVSAARLLPEIPFAVAGSTERMPHLVRDSPNNLKWLGFLQETDLNALYERTRFIVSPSRCFEGFPNSVAKAMVMEKPVIAARLGGVPEIVEDGKTGLLFEAGNVPELAMKIQALYSNDALCREMGLAGSIKARTQYSAEVVYERLMEIYNKALRN